MSELRRRPEGESLTLGGTMMVLGRLKYSPTVVRVYGMDGSLFSSYMGSFDGTRVGSHDDEVRLYFDLPHFLAWLSSPNGTRLDLSRLSAFRVGSEATADEEIELWRDGRLAMEIKPADPSLHEWRERGR